MSDLGQDLKNYVKKGIEAIGNTASDIAENTKQLVSKLSIENRRDEILNESGKKAYALWLTGVGFPEDLSRMFAEVNELDEQLKRFESVKGEACSFSDDNAQKNCCNCTGMDQCTSEQSVTKDNGVPVIHAGTDTETEEKPQTPLSSAINALFEQTPPVDQMAEKMNSSLDEMGEQLRKFSSDLGKQISDLADELMEKDKKD